MFCLDQNLTLESFQRQWPLKVKRAKSKFSDSHGHNILELSNVLAKVKLTKGKMKLDV